ncbi:MAG: ABC transporter substrate-binding protein [Pseudomonadota bacterium]
MMRQAKPSVTRFFRLAAAAGALAMAAACAGGPANRGADDPSAAAEPQVDPVAPVAVAILAPTTAGSESLRRAAQDLVAAAQLARAERAPENLVLKVYDTKGTGQGAAAATAKALADGSAMIVGPLLGASAKAAGPVAAQRGVNMLAFSNDETAAGGNVWVLGPLVRDELERLFGYAGARGLSQIAVAYPANRYGQVVASEAEQAASASGVAVGPFFAYERSVEGIAGAVGEGVEAMQASAVDGVLIADRGDALRFIAKAFAGNGVGQPEVRYLGLGVWDDPRNGDEPAMHGGWFVGGDPTADAVFERRFRSRMGRAPHPAAATAYDAVAAAAAMLRDAAAGGEPAFTRRAITRGRGFEGAAGGFRLLGDGTNRRSLAVKSVAPGGSRVLDAAPRGAPAS